jgi:membrane-bound lytic murein transglycosylase D
MKNLRHYIRQAKSESVPFSTDAFSELLDSAPTIPTEQTQQFSATTLSTFQKMIGITLSLTTVCAIVWFNLPIQEVQQQKNVELGRTSLPHIQMDSTTSSTTSRQSASPTRPLASNIQETASRDIEEKTITPQETQNQTNTPTKGLIRTTQKTPYAKRYEQSKRESDIRFNATLEIAATARMLSSFRIPSTLSFCDEPLPLDDIEVRERLDREFMSVLQQSGRLLIYLKRAKRWFPVIERILKEENMHEDLKYLCVAESELSQVRSEAGAVGFWQFIDVTAKQYGLQVDEFVDERKNVEKSTRAACSYFRNAKRKLSSWTLCAAGYNQGVAGTQRDIDFQNTTNYFDLYLNEETSRYVSRIAVIKHIMENAKNYGLIVGDDEVMYQPFSTETVTVTGAIPNLNEWANEHNCSYKYLKILNPWIKKSELPAPTDGGKWAILIPKQ